MELSPRDFGLAVQSGAGIQGGGIELNRVIAEAVLGGERGAARDIVVMNAALALVAAEKAVDFREGVVRAEESIDSGAAGGKLSALRDLAPV
jgi:anthranilate phosphoribosyltransferase